MAEEMALAKIAIATKSFGFLKKAQHFGPHEDQGILSIFPLSHVWSLLDASAT
ncbi:MAG: hypothetical protein ACI9NQ_000304 [Paracoccaceae bacterium]